MTAEPADRGEIKLHILDYWRIIRVRFPLIVLVFLLVVITAAVVTYFTPKKYASTVTMQLRNEETPFAVFDKSGSREGFDPRFITTQFEIIQKKEILYPVIETLGLVKKWGLASREQAYFRLTRGMISVRELRNTELITITVYSTDNKEAMEIANSVAEEYKKRRIAEQGDWARRSLGTLEEEVAKQRAQVAELSKKMEAIRVEQGIVDTNPSADTDSNLPENQVYGNVEQMVSTERLKVATLRSKYEQIVKMTDEAIMRSLPSLEMQDTTIATLFPQYQEAVSEEVRLLNAGLGPNHPSVQSLHAKKDEMWRQLTEQMKVLRKTMETNLNIAEDGLRSLEARLNEAKTSMHDLRSRSISYYNAKNDYLQAKRILEAAETRLTSQKIEQGMPQSPVVIWEKAEVPTSPVSRVWLIMGAGVAAGLILGVGLAFFIEYLDTSVKTMEDIESFLQVPVLAVIPKGISLLINGPSNNADAEAYRILRTNIEFNRKNPEANTITIISGGAGEGKSTTMANLAAIFAAGGYSTLVVDADLRRPSQHRIFGTENDIGLTDFLTKDVHLEEVVSQTKLDNLYLLTSGSLAADAVGVLNSQRMVDLIEDVKHRFDIVFFDSPPILGVSDASVLCSAVDLTIIVVQHRRFPRAMLNRVKQAVINVGGTILGVVLNNVDVRHDQHYEYYTSYYSYYAQKPAKPTSALPKRLPAAAARSSEPEQSSDTDSY